MKIHVLGVGATEFGELWDISPRAMAQDALFQAMQTSRVETERIDALFVGNMLSGILSNQANLGTLFAEDLCRGIPAFRIEGACASGGLALHNAINSIRSGVYKTVAVLGIEKTTDHTQEQVQSALMAAGSDEERHSGITYTGLFALMAQAYMQQYRVTHADIAASSVKNHYHGSLNPNAQFQKVITVEDVLKGAKIADPLRLLDCAPVSDGACAVILSSDATLIKKQKKPVAITASVVATDTLSLHNRKSFTSFDASVNASKIAYKTVGIKPKDIDVAEVHDCFSIAEVMAVEDLGFSGRGMGAKDIAAGKFTLGIGEKIINPSGGLKACGYAIGATGVKQVVEVVKQLWGKSKIGLTQNVGGSGSVAVVHILER